MEEINVFQTTSNYPHQMRLHRINCQTFVLRNPFQVTLPIPSPEICKQFLAYL